MSEDLLDEVVWLKDELDRFMQPTGLPFEKFEAVGVNGIIELHENQVPYDQAVFCDGLYAEIQFLPKDVVISIALGAAYLMSGLGAYKDSHPAALSLLMHASRHIGFVSGVSYGMVHHHEYRSKLASQGGKLGGKANARNASAAKLKDWVDKQPNPLRRSDKPFARDLSERAPRDITKELADPERVIYDHLRNQN